MDLRAKVETEVHKEATVPSAPNYSVDDEIEARQARFEAVIDEYNAANRSSPLTVINSERLAGASVALPAGWHGGWKCR
jgi:hypothetical protein